MASERELLRARVFLHSVLPLLEVVMREQPKLARQFAATRATVQIDAHGCPDGARLLFDAGTLRVERGQGESDLQIRFKDVAALNRFFAGEMVLPRIQGVLRHPLLLARSARLLLSLQLLQPGPPGDSGTRALRVKLLLRLAIRALAQLHHGGHGGMAQLARDSPDRVYQWTVQGEALVWLRMRAGRVACGEGACPAREPFVHFVFPTMDAAHAVLTAGDNQVDGLRDGSVAVFGSPEYSRKISLLMQQVDELLMEG